MCIIADLEQGRLTINFIWKLYFLVDLKISRQSNNETTKQQQQQQQSKIEHKVVG